MPPKIVETMAYKEFQRTVTPIVSWSIRRAKRSSSAGHGLRLPYPNDADDSQMFCVLCYQYSPPACIAATPILPSTASGNQNLPKPNLYASPLL